MAAVSPTYWDTPTGLPGLGCLQREFFTWSTWTTTSASFFWPVPFLYHPSSNACFLKELSTKGITFSPERHLLTAQIPCSLSLFRLSGKHSLKRIDFTYFERKGLIFKRHTFLHCACGWASGVCCREQKVGRKGNVFNFPGLTSSRLIKWIAGVGVQWE